MVYIGGHSCSVQRVAVGKNRHARPELDFFGSARQPGEHDEGIVERSWKARSDVRSNGNVIGDHDEVIAQALGLHGPALENTGRSSGAEVENIHANLHEFSPTR